jgi:hypothetical protein
MHGSAAYSKANGSAQYQSLPGQRELQVIETVFPDPWACQKTPSLAGGMGGSPATRTSRDSPAVEAACRTSRIRASALFTPRYWGCARLA